MTTQKNKTEVVEEDFDDDMTNEEVMLSSLEALGVSTENMTGVRIEMSPGKPILVTAQYDVPHNYKGTYH